MFKYCPEIAAKVCVSGVNRRHLVISLLIFLKNKQTNKKKRLLLQRGFAASKTWVQLINRLCLLNIRGHPDTTPIQDTNGIVEDGTPESNSMQEPILFILRN